MRIDLNFDIGMSVKTFRAAYDKNTCHFVINWHFANCESELWVSNSGEISFRTTDLSSTEYNSWIREYNVLDFKFDYRKLWKTFTHKCFAMR